MRSKEVADLAGVSVRTLRHYHQIGALPEPERSSNGYRHYELSHVAVLLRIRRLAALGVSLEAMPSYLDAAAGSDPDQLLVDLDRELQRQIAHLSEQRQRISQIRSSRQRPDLPPGLEIFAGLFGGRSHPAAELEQDASLVLAQLAGDSYESDLRELGKAVARADENSAVSACMARYLALAPDATAQEVERLTDEFIGLLGPALTDYLTSASGLAVRRTQPGSAPEIDDDPRLNAPQASILRMIAVHLENIGAQADEAVPSIRHHRGSTTRRRPRP